MPFFGPSHHIGSPAGRAGYQACVGGCRSLHAACSRPSAICINPATWSCLHRSPGVTAGMTAWQPDPPTNRPESRLLWVTAVQGCCSRNPDVSHPLLMIIRNAHDHPNPTELGG